MGRWGEGAGRGGRGLAQAERRWWRIPPFFTGPVRGVRVMKYYYSNQLTGSWKLQMLLGLWVVRSYMI